MILCPRVDGTRDLVQVIDIYRLEFKDFASFGWAPEACVLRHTRVHWLDRGRRLARLRHPKEVPKQIGTHWFRDEHLRKVRSESSRSDEIYE